MENQQPKTTTQTEIEILRDLIQAKYLYISATHERMEIQKFDRKTSAVKK